MKRLENSEQYKLSEKYTIYKSTYENIFTKKDFLKRVYQNELIYYNETYEIHNSLEVHIECEEFKSVDKQALNFLRTKLCSDIDKFIKSSWVYVQVPSFKMEWMHTHDTIDFSNSINLKTQWTYIFYIQIPTTLKDGEGDLIFKTEDGEFYVFTPKENDIIFFPGDLLHMATPTPSSDSDRIIYGTNINYDFKTFRDINKRIKFKNHINN